MAAELAVVLSAAEARGLVDQIRANLDSARGLLLELYNREGWRALGYDSWRACVVAEFAGSQAYLYRELVTAQVEVNVFSTCEISELPQTHARELINLSSQMQGVAYEIAGATGQRTAGGLAELVHQLNTVGLAEVLSKLNPEQLAKAIKAQEAAALAGAVPDSPRAKNYPRRLGNCERDLIRIECEYPAQVARVGLERVRQAARTLDELAAALKG